MPRGTTANDDWVDDGTHHHYCTMRMTLAWERQLGRAVFFTAFYLEIITATGTPRGARHYFRGWTCTIKRERHFFLFGWVLYRIRRRIWAVKAGHLLRRHGVGGGIWLSWCFGGHGRLPGVDRQDGGSGNPHAARCYAWQ